MGLRNMTSLLLLLQTSSWSPSLKSPVQVGFGDVTPNTHGGLWFSIPWMLFGVASFANLVGRFSVLMMNTQQRRMSRDLLEELRDDPILVACRQDRENVETQIPANAILRAEFILHALLQDGLVSESIAEQLSKDFDTCDVTRNGWLDDDDLVNLMNTSSRATPDTEIENPLLRTE